MVVPPGNANISVALRRIVVGSLGFFANEIWLEQFVDATETFSVYRDDVSVWEFEGLLLVDDTTVVYKILRMSAWNGKVHDLFTSLSEIRS